MSKRRNHGFTLVELLVVIAIIGLLVGLLLPAVQAAREAARNTQCKNHLKQLALACLNYESGHRVLPGYAGELWPGEQFFTNQQGSVRPRMRGANWITKILPFIEQASLANEWELINANASWGVYNRNSPPLNSVVGGLYCPSRRNAEPYPVIGSRYYVEFGDSASRNDYVMCAGAGVVESNGWQMDHQHPGVFQFGKFTKLGAVTDGLSNTYLIGEKSMNPNKYETGSDEGDRAPALGAGGWTGITSHARIAVRPAIPDATRKRRPWASDCVSCHDFGSAHVATWNMSFADGSVHSIFYNQAFDVHYSNASINGGEVSFDK